MAVHYAPKTITNGLVLHLDAGNSRSYPGSGNTWFDLSGRNNNLTLYNSPTFSINFFIFNSSPYARTTTLPITSTTNFTISAWIKPSNLNQLGMVVSVGRDDGNAPLNGFSFGMGDGASGSSVPFGAGGKLQASNGGVSWLNPEYTFSSINIWYNIIWTRDSTTSRWYVNGVQTPNTSTSSPVTPTQNFVVGAAFGVGATRYFSGSISVVQIYERAISAAEIQQNFNATRGRFGI